MGCDRISELPDSLLTQILSYLRTKDSVKTSVLTKRWKSLWISVPVLDFKVSDFPPYSQDLANFVDKFLDSNQNTRMQTFKIKHVRERFVEWTRTAVDLGIERLDVETDIAPCIRDSMPMNIYKSNTLVSLKLVTVGIGIPEFVVSLPYLKMLHLEDVWCNGDSLIIEKLVSGCPVLEDLTLIRPLEALGFLRVRSQTLKRFRFANNDCTGGSVEIDAPRLEYLSFKDNRSDRIVVKNPSSLVKIDVDTEFDVGFAELNVVFGYTLDPEELVAKRDMIRDFLTRISSVRHMIISQRTLQVLYLNSDLGPIPKFDNLYHLEAAFSSSMLQFLPVFLDSFPNLKNLIVDFAVTIEPGQTEVTYLPQCLLPNLECVEIKKLITEEGSWKKLARYFLENSVVLKKLILHFKESIANQYSDIFKELLTYTKRSLSCEIIIIH